MPTPDDKTYINPELKKRIKEAKEKNLSAKSSSYYNTAQLPEDLFYAADKGNWDLSQLPQDPASLYQRAYDEQVARGERFSLRIDNFLNNIGTGFKATTQAIWEDDERNPVYQTNNTTPIYRNPMKGRMAPGSGYWADQLEQMGLSVGIMGGMATDPVNLATTAAAFIPGLQGATVAKTAQMLSKVPKLMKAINNTGQLLRTSRRLSRMGKVLATTDAMRLANGLYKAINTGMRAGIGIRGGEVNARINRGFVEDDAYTQAINEGMSPEEAYNIAKKKGEKQYNLEKWVDMALGAMEVMTALRSMRNVPNGMRRVFGFKNAPAKGMFNNRWANFGMDLGKASLIEGAQEVWEEISAIYGESLGTENEIKSWKDLFLDPKARQQIMSQKERLIDSFIGGTMGGLLFGGLGKTGVALRERAEDKRMKTNLQSDQNRLQRLMLSTLTKPEKIQLEYEKKVLDAQDKLSKLQKGNASAADIASAQKALTDLQIESTNLDTKTLLEIKRLSLSMQEADPDTIADYNHDFNESMVARINAIDTIQKAQATNPDILKQDNTSNEELSKAISVLKDYGIIDSDNNVTNGRTLEEYKQQTQKLYHESIQMDIDYLDGFFRVTDGNNSMSYQYMVDKAMMRDIDSRIGQYRDSINDIFEYVLDEGATDSERKSAARKTLELVRETSKDENEKKKIDEILDNDFADVKGLSEEDVENLRKVYNEKYDEVEASDTARAKEKKNIKAKRNEAKQKLFDSADTVVRNIIGAFIGGMDETQQQILGDYIGSETMRILQTLDDIRKLEKQKKSINDRIGEYESGKNRAYHEAKTAYLGCCVSISESGRNLRQQLADTSDAITLCMNPKLKNNKEIQGYIRDLLIRHARIRKVMLETSVATEQTQQTTETNATNNNTTPVTDTTEEESVDVLASMHDKMKQNTCDILLDQIEKHSRVGKMSINDFLKITKALTATEIKEPKEQEETKEDRGDAIAAAIRVKKEGESIVTTETPLTQEEKKVINEAIEQVTASRTEKMIEDIRVATNIFQQNELGAELEQIAERYNVSINDVQAVVTDLHTLFDGIDFTGVEKSSPYYQTALNKAVEKIVNFGLDYDSVLESRMDILHCIFKSKGFYDTTIDELKDTFKQFYTTPEKDSETKIQEAEKEDSRIKAEEHKKIGTDYDILQMTAVEQTPDGKYVFTTGVIGSDGKPVMTQKGFARLNRLNSKSKARVFIKGFNGDFAANKKAFKEYLKEIFNYNIAGYKRAIDNFKQQYGRNFYAVIENDSELESLWNNRETLFGLANHPVYATDEKGDDAVVIGFIPTADYYSYKNCSLFKYENGEKKVGTENERNSNISTLNRGTKYINKQQASGNVEFSVNIRDRQTSELNRSNRIEGVSVNEGNVTIGLKAGKGNMEAGIYMIHNDSTQGVRKTVPVLLHFPGNTFVDDDNQIRIFTSATADKMDLGKQNPAFFENFKNNLIDIIIKYATNRMLDMMKQNPDIDIYDTCHSIVQTNKELLRVTNVEESAKRLREYVLRQQNKFNLKSEITKKTDGRHNNDGAFLIEQNYMGGGLCGFSINADNGHLQLMLGTAGNTPELQNKICRYNRADVAKDINALLNYVNNAFSANGIANKALVRIKDFRDSTTIQGQNQFSRKVYTDEVCGNNLESLTDDDFVPIKKEAKRVTEYINEIGGTNIRQVAITKENGQQSYDIYGNPETTVFSGIIRTLKPKPASSTASPIRPAKNNTKSSVLNFLAKHSRVSKVMKINRKGVITGLTYIQQKEMCKSIFSYLMDNDQSLKDDLINNRMSVNRLIEKAKKLLREDRISLFPSMYGLYDKIAGVSERSNNRDYLEFYSVDPSQLVDKQIKNITDGYNLLESLGNEENIDILFRLPSFNNNNLQVGMFTSYITQLLGRKLNIDDTEVEQGIDETQNDSLDAHIKSDFEKEDIKDFSTYLKCVLSSIPKDENKDLSFYMQSDMYEYENIEDVIGVVSHVFVSSQCNWNDFMANLKGKAEDHTYKHFRMCSNLIDIFESEYFDEQHKREITSKLTKAFVDMNYVYQSKDGKLITINSESGKKKQKFELSKSIKYCKHARYFKYEKGSRRYDAIVFNGMLGNIDDVLYAMTNDEYYDIADVKEIIRNIYGIDISTETIRANEDLVKQLLLSTVSLKDAIEKGYTETPFEHAKLSEGNPLVNLIEKECLMDDTTTDMTNFINGKLVMNTYFRTLREKLFKDINDGEGNMFADAIDDLYKVEIDGAEYYVFPQLELLQNYPLMTGLVSLSALNKQGKKTSRITELSAGEQAGIEAVYATEPIGKTRKKTLNIHGFNGDKEVEFFMRNGYSLAYTVSDKQKLSYVRAARIVIPVTKDGYIDPKNNTRSLAIDQEKLYDHVTQQILDSELMRIERELDINTKIPDKTGRHLILSIPHLNTIEVNVNGNKQDLESLLRQCYENGTEEVFKYIRDDYDNIYRQAKKIVKNAIERSVANLVCNDTAKQKIKEGSSILNADGSLALTFDDMAGSLWDNATIMVADNISGRKYMRPQFMSSDYERTVIDPLRPEKAIRNDNGDLIQGTPMETDLQIVYAAFDQVVNTYLTNLMLQNCVYGPLNNTSKIKNYNSLAQFDAGENAIYDENDNRNEIKAAEKNNELEKICNIMGVNINKRMSGADGSGRMLDFEGITHEGNSEWGGGKEFKNSLFKYLIVNETEKIAPTYKNIVELHYGKQNEEVYELINKAKYDKDAKKKKDAKNKLEKMFPSVSSYLNIDTTDGAEFVTAREAVDWLLGKGDLPKEQYDKLQQMYLKMDKEELTGEEQRELWEMMNEYNKVINPSKPMCYGVMALGKDGKPATKYNPAVTMHTFYGKSAMVPLLPNFTKGTKLDLVRKALEKMEHENQMNVRLIFNSAVKIGSVEESKRISFERVCEIGSDIINGNPVDMTDMDNSSVYMHRKFLMSQMETNSHREEIMERENNNDADRMMNEIDKMLNNGQTKIVDSTQMDHILEGIGINKINNKIFKLPKRVCETFSSPERYEIKDGEYYVDGKEFERIRLEFTRRRVDTEFDKLLREFGISDESEINLDNKAFIQNLARILGTELLSRGNDPNILAQMGLVEHYDKTKDAYEFKIPLPLQTSSTKMQILLMSIIRTRLCKNKLPGNPMYTASSEGFEKMNVVSDKDASFDSKGVIWLDKNSKGILGSTLNEDGTLKCADIAIPSQFMTRDENGKLQHLDFFAHDKDGKLIYLVGENGQPLYVDRNNKIVTDHEGVYLKTDMVDNELIDKMMSLRIPVSGHMSGAAVRIVAFLPDSMGDTIIVPAEHFKQLGEDLDIDKRFLYLKNYIVENNGHISVLTEEKIDAAIQNAAIDKAFARFLKKKKPYFRSIDGVRVSDAELVEFGKQYGILNTEEAVKDVIYNYGEAKAKIEEWYRESLEQKLRENENIDFYVSIFANPDTEIQKMIQRVLNFEDLVKTKDFILSLQNSTNNDFISVFDSVYQQNLRISNSGSLMGVGAMSLAVVQGAMFSKRAITIERGFMMDGFTSRGVLGNIKTLDGRTFIYEVLSSLQNGNVDNVKENLCGPINMNQITFPFYEMMAWLGFNKTQDGKHRLDVLLAAQPIIKEYVRLKTIQKAVLKKRSYNDIEILKQCLKSVGFTDENIKGIFEGQNNYGIVFKNGAFVGTQRTKQDPYGITALNCDSSQLIGCLEGKKDGITALKALGFFWNVSKSAGAISKYTNLLNATSKGVGNSYLEVYRRIRLLNDMGADVNFSLVDNEDGSKSSSITSLIGDFVLIEDGIDFEKYKQDGYIHIKGCDYLIRPTTNEGIVLMRALQMSERLLSETFGYSNETMWTIYNRVLDTMIKAKMSSDDIDMFERQIPEAIKEYMYKLCGDSKFLKGISEELGTEINGLWSSSFKEEEERLMRPVYDEYTLESNPDYIKAMDAFLDDTAEGDRTIQLKPGDRVNLGYIITFLKRAGIAQDDLFLDSLQVQQNGTLRYVQKANMLSNDDVLNGFVEMFNKDGAVQINGHNVVANGEMLTWQNLAKDIAAYAYLCDNENGILNLREHIPMEYIEETKTDLLLRYLYDHIGNFFDVDTFVEQFFTTFPEAVTSLNIKNPNIAGNVMFSNRQGQTFDASSPYVQFADTMKVIGSEDLLSETGWEKDIYDNVQYPELLSVNVNDSLIVFKHTTDGIYKKLPTIDKKFGVNTLDPSQKSVTVTQSAVVETPSVYTPFNATTDKVSAVEQIRSRLDPSEPMTKVANLLLESILKNDLMSLSIEIVPDGSDPITRYEKKTDDNSYYYTLKLPNCISNSQLLEELMHVAQFAELARCYTFKEVDGIMVVDRTKNMKYDCFKQSYTMFELFKQWWEKNGEDYKQHKQELIHSIGYESQLESVVTDFAEFLAAGASMNPVFLDMAAEFEKSRHMTENNVITKIIDGIKRVFERLIRSLFGEQTKLVQTTIDETLKAINVYFLRKNAEAMYLKDTTAIDKKIGDIIEQIHQNLYYHNDPSLEEAITIDNMTTTTNNVKEQYRGKIVLAPYGMGKSTAANNENVIDMDYIWAETIAKFVSPNELAQFNGIIEADRWVEQQGKTSLAWGRITQEVVKRCNELLEEGKTILASPTILNGRYGNLINRIGGIVAAKNIKEEIVSNMLSRRNQFDNKEGYAKRLDEQLATLRAFAIKQSNIPQHYIGLIQPDNNTVFVFGSNPEGRHGAGSAKIARERFGAIYGQGEGLQGNSYALPTKDLRIKENNGLRSISQKQIIENIKKMYNVASANPNKQFKVAYTNRLDETSLNGYTGAEMIQMFKDAGPIPSNVIFSKNWTDNWNKVNNNNKISNIEISVDQYVSDVIYDNPPKQHSPKNAFAVSFDDQGQRMVQPIRIDDAAETEAKEKQEATTYPNLC